MAGLYTMRRGDMTMAPNANADYGPPPAQQPPLGLPGVERPPTKLLGRGAAYRAGNTVALRNAYNLYVQDMQSAGNPPLPFEEWIQETYDPDMRGTLYEGQ
jgi:hypothetical protein